MRIQFHGAAQRVTGSKHLITTPKGTQILLDCGLFQGIDTTELNLTFGFDPKRIDYVILSHAHIDHTGLLPRLYRQGFRGTVFATHATKSLCEIMLLDSAHIQKKDLERVNERRKKRGEPILELLYDEADVAETLLLFKTCDFNKPYQIRDEATFSYYYSGHILGSGGVFLEIADEHYPKKLFFTGDIGRPNDKILRDPQPFPQADYIICESTYGDRLHEPEADAKSHLIRIVRETCVNKRGKVIIPAFAVDRTQELIYALDQIAAEGGLPRLPVYVDSPLSVKATAAMRRHADDFNQNILEYIKRYGDAFDFPNLHYITDVEDSKRLNASDEPCIIISSSGMAEAGRIKHHIANNVEDPRNTILIVGYCSPETLGYALKTGEKMVRIFGKDYVVKAEVQVMDSFSAHADYAEMIQYLKCQDAAKVKELFLVHGDVETQKNFAQKLRAEGFRKVSIPAQGDEVVL